MYSSPDTSREPATDPAERQRRVGQVYVLLVDLARKKKAAALGERACSAQPTD